MTGDIALGPPADTLEWDIIPLFRPIKAKALRLSSMFGYVISVVWNLQKKKKSETLCLNLMLLGVTVMPQKRYYKHLAKQVQLRQQERYYKQLAKRAGCGNKSAWQNKRS